MSIPTNQLVFAGIWNSTTPYPQFYFVLSPIDNLCYINITPSPVLGGSDPSVQPSTVWLLFPNVTGDITGIIAGTGIAGGGSSGSVTISNAGVTSLQSLTGAVTLSSPTATFTNVGNNIELTIPNPPVYRATYYKSVRQNLINADTDITFDVVAPWSNINGYITHTSGTANFRVAVAGLYQLEFNISINANGATWNNALNKIVSIDITRTPSGERAVIQNDALTAVSTSYQQAVASSFYLEVGDIINLRNTLAFASATPFAVGVQNTFDLNTFFTWTFVAP